MGNYQLRITLLSDLCVSDGGVYNSALDTDICHDELGFPYIPAKRIKGCLRECALELRDWGRNVPIEEIFGAEGFRKAALRLGNAYLEGIGEKRTAAEKYRDTLLCHPQNILNHFSYIRTQTSIDYETGVADDTTLRTMRVAKRGLVFVAEAEIEDSYENDLSDCCLALKSMGIARTRGLGEVEAAFVTRKDSKGFMQCEDSEKKPENFSLVEGADCLTYTIHLKEPMICKSINGGEEKTLDYIEGSKILGLIAGELRSAGKDIKAFLKKSELFCSNAYIEQNEKRMLEVPATFYSIKNEESCYVDKTYSSKAIEAAEKQNRRQLSQMGHCYVSVADNGELTKAKLKMEERYHHRRPEDKSVGRAVEGMEGGSVFYQMSSIMKGQNFQGYITGSAEQIREIYQLLSQRQEYYMGYSNSSEYGKVTLWIKETSKSKEEKWENCKDFAVKLEAPVILYGTNAMYSTDTRELIAEINAQLGITEEVFKAGRIEKYINYTTIGGYNVTWHARKPMLEVFDKGTVLCFHLDAPMDLPKKLLLGERVAEGFGEAAVTPIIMEKGRYENKVLDGKGKKEGATIEEGFASDSPFLKDICQDLFYKFLHFDAVKEADEYKIKTPETLAPTVSNMILMCKESESLSQVKESTERRFQKKSDKKRSKLETARKIFLAVEERSRKLWPEFCGKYQIAMQECPFAQDVYELAYMKAYLTGLKHLLRSETGENV